jgi:hypothetical protein
MTRKKPMGRGRSSAFVLTPIVLVFVLDAIAQGRSCTQMASLRLGNQASVE